jgi:methylthioribose-1-phosphate isomerase
VLVGALTQETVTHQISSTALRDAPTVNHARAVGVDLRMKLNVAEEKHVLLQMSPTTSPLPQTRVTREPAGG